MRYLEGECLNDYGFRFLEKIREPIFLVDRNGQILKFNEAARKLLVILKLDRSLVGRLAPFKNLLRDDDLACRNMVVGRRLRLTSRKLKGSDFFLIELTRRK